MHKYILTLLLLGTCMASQALESTKKTFIYNISSIERVIDGDTVEAVLDLGFNIFFKVSIRIDGIDTPEKNTPEGKLVKAYSENWFKTGYFTLNSKELDKYGRVLGTISKTENNTAIDYSTHMITEGYARVYNGEKKKDWTQTQITTILEKLKK